MTKPQPEPGLGFEAALKCLREGHKAGRRGWNGKGMFVMLQTPDANSKMSLPYLYMFTAQEQRVPWVISHSDLLEKDWEIIA